MKRLNDDSGSTVMTAVVLVLQFVILQAMERLVFGGVLSASIVVIFAVHYQQKADRATMHEGVLRDKERMEAKRRNKLNSSLGNGAGDKSIER
jgi:PET assembly of cytochrome c oxidase, mitochondrial